MDIDLSCSTRYNMMNMFDSEIVVFFQNTMNSQNTKPPTQTNS